MKAQRGFTMIEVIVAITIMAILMTIAVPSFRDASLGSQLRALSGDLLASASLARSEAVKRNAPVVLCASTDGATCAAGGSWESGWIVHHASDVLLRSDAAPAGFRIIPAGGAVQLAFLPTGVGATPESLKICRASGQHERVVTIDAAGRASTRRTTSASCP